MAIRPGGGGYDPEARRHLETIARVATVPWFRQPAIVIAVIALIIALLALFRDYLGLEFGRSYSTNKTDATAPAMRAPVLPPK